MRICRVEVTAGALLLAAWLNYLDRSLLVPLTMLACAVHELGHYLAIRLLGGDVRLMRITAIGAELVLGDPLSYWQEGMAALAGPGAGLLIALICCCGEGRWLTFAGANLALSLFNLLPAGRLDGGRALYCTLALLGGPGLAGRASAWLDRLCIAGILLAGILLVRSGGSSTLLLVALWMLAACLKQNFRAV